MMVIGVLESRVGVPKGEKGERSHLFMLLSVLENFEMPEGGERVICCRQVRGEDTGNRRQIIENYRS